MSIALIEQLGVVTGKKEATVTMRIPTSMILCALAVSGLLLVLFTTCPAQESHLVAAEANPRFADTRSNEGERCKLPPNALQMARIIGVESDIEKLSCLAAAKGAGTAPGCLLRNYRFASRSPKP